MYLLFAAWCCQLSWFYQKFTVSGAFPAGQHSWNCVCTLCVIESLRISVLYVPLPKKKAKAVLVFFLIFVFKPLLEFTGVKNSAGPCISEHPVTEVSTVSFEVSHEKPTPKLCMPWAAEANTVPAEGPNYPCWHHEQMIEPEAPTTGLGKCHRSLKNNKNMEISPEGMRVTQRSHQGNCRKISTDKHTDPRSSSALGDKPITVGSSDCCTPSNHSLIAWGQSTQETNNPQAMQTATLPAKIPFLKAPNQKQPSQERNTLLLAFASHPGATRREEPKLLKELSHPESRKQQQFSNSALDSWVLCHLWREWNQARGSVCCQK